MFEWIHALIERRCTRVYFWLPAPSISVSIIPKAVHVSRLDWNLSTNFIHLSTHRCFASAKRMSNEPRPIPRQFIALPLRIGRQSNVKRRCFELHRHKWRARKSRNRVQGIRLFSYVVEIDCVRWGVRFLFFNFFASPKQIFFSPSLVQMFSPCPKRVAKGRLQLLRTIHSISSDRLEQNLVKPGVMLAVISFLPFAWANNRLWSKNKYSAPTPAVHLIRRGDAWCNVGTVRWTEKFIESKSTLSRRWVCLRNMASAVWWCSLCTGYATQVGQSSNGF